MHIEVCLGNLHKECDIALKLIQRFFVINKINRVLKLVYDFELDEQGTYWAGDKNTIVINPDNCFNMRMYDDEDDSKDNMFFLHYLDDNSLMAGILHEFAHFICFQLFKSLLVDYKQEFPNNRLYLSSYSNSECDEELANVIQVYIANPFLLKLVSEDHYNFLKRYFKSPTPCSSKDCFNKYQKFPIHIKNHLKTKWEIEYNQATDTFDKIKKKEA